MEIDFDGCFRCGACAAVCPLDVIDVTDSHVEVGEGCTDCGLCVDTCPVGVIEIA